LNPTVPHLVPDTTQVRLQPVPIGAIDPPIQILRVFNASSADAEYRIDLTQVQEVAETNHNFDIFRALNPTGVIRARSDGYFRFVFKPLEAIEYEVSILCLVATGNNFTFTLSGRGVHTDHDECELSWPIFPPKSLGITNASMLTLSEQFLDFGDIPVLVRLDRMLFMNNISDRTLLFEVELPCDAFRIEPRQGEIAPHSQVRLLLTIDGPESPTIMQMIIPIVFQEPVVNTSRSRSTQVVDNDEEILAADPPIDRTIQAKRIAALKKLRQREENWKSVGERTLEASTRAKPTTNNDNLFSTHIGQRGPAGGGPRQSIYRQLLDIVVNVMSREEYRDVYGSIDTYVFEAQNPTTVEFELRQKEEIAEILGSLVDRVISDEQEKRLSLRDAKLRHEHVPLFQQLYKNDPVIEVEHQEVPNARKVDQIQEFLHSVIDDIIIEANAGTFPLMKDIIHVSGFRAME
jgi:hypothetical protein